MSERFRTIAALFLMGPVVVPTALSQLSEKFEAVSIRPCKDHVASSQSGEPGSRSRIGASSPGLLHLNCQSVMSLVQWAYVNYANDRFNPLAAIPISGGPAWIHSDLYEIEANASGPLKAGLKNGAMLREILEDRFRLKIHREKIDGAVYALTVAKDGPKLQPARDADCIPSDPERPPSPPAPGKALPRLCGVSQVTRTGYDAYGVTLADFCRLISDYLDRTAIDQTGVAGRFNIHLNLAAADLGRSPGVVDDPTVSAANADPADVSSALRAAMGELGLKLKPARGQVDRLVIDHVQRPSPN